jgi:A/G-specific adenine glycosylase
VNSICTAQFHKKLHQWYQKNGRHHLPWRNTRDPYAIYISEIMLQQTQVKTVLERYYFPFLAKFPTLGTLAEAPQNEVLNAWQGLGYYNRALNMHKTANQCIRTLPDSVEALIALPGIGKNTAHAVAAFAFHQPVAVMEANVKRVLSRIFALKQPSDASLWESAQALLNKKNPFDYNQAMMDLGSLVCKKTNPDCTSCPANFLCLGKEHPDHYPEKKKKKSVPIRYKNIVVLRNHLNQFFLTPRTTRFLQGLYHFPECNAGLTSLTHSQKTFHLNEGKFMGAICQQYSHFTLQADIYHINAKKMTGEGWHDLQKLKQLPVSKAEEKIIDFIDAL